MTPYNNTREHAHNLLTQYTKSESLMRHAYAVEASMLYYAKLGSYDPILWGNTGLLHDFDYEMYPSPTPEGHPYVGCQILRDHAYPDTMCEAIMGHALYSGVPRTTDLAKTLFAVDELSGLVYASVLVRPDKDINNLEVASVKKKMKDKAFAKGVSRDDIKLGLEETGLDLDVHVGNVIQALRERKDLVFG